MSLFLLTPFPGGEGPGGVGAVQAGEQGERAEFDIVPAGGLGSGLRGEQDIRARGAHRRDEV